MRSKDFVDHLGGYFIGTVVAIITPGQTTNQGGYSYTHNTFKVQLSSDPVFTGIPTELLPFATIMRPLFRGSSANVGMYSVPRIGSTVVFVFENSCSHSPIVIGELWTSAVVSSSPLLPSSSNTTIYGFEDEHGNIFSVDANGNITVQTGPVGSSAAQSIILKSGATTITIQSDTVNISAKTTINVNAPTVNITSTTSNIKSGTINLGSGTFFPVLQQGMTLTANISGTGTGQTILVTAGGSTITNSA